MTAGTVFLMWIGEQIDEFGIGNGISLLIMAGILSDMPGAGMQLIETASLELTGGGGELGIEQLLDPGAHVRRRDRRRGVHHARPAAHSHAERQARPRPPRDGRHPAVPAAQGESGRRHADHLRQQLADAADAAVRRHGGLVRLERLGRSQPESGSAEAFQQHGLFYAVCYIALIYFFCFFWTAITFNPKDVSDNLKNYGSFIPGYRPGKRTADYLEKVMFRITYVGAGFLALVAIIPMLVSGSLGVSPLIASFYGGTGLLIAVSVAFDLVQKIDSHLVMRNYKGLLES